MDYKYKGRCYQLRLTNDGMIEVVGEGIEAASVAEAQLMIRTNATKEEKAEKVTVYLTNREMTVIYEGQTTGVKSGNSYSGGYFTTWRDEKGKPQRGKKSSYELYKGTKENREKLEAIRDIKLRVKALEDEARKIEDTCVMFEGSI